MLFPVPIMLFPLVSPHPASASPSAETSALRDVLHDHFVKVGPAVSLHLRTGFQSMEAGLHMFLSSFLSSLCPRRLWAHEGRDQISLALCCILSAIMLPGT